MTLELFGLARSLTGRPEVTLEVPEPARLRDVLAALVRAYPALRGTVIDVHAGSLIEPNVLLLDGRRAVDPSDLFSEADKPCILLLPSGG